MIWQNETKEAVLSTLGTSAQTGLFKQQVAEAQKTQKTGRGHECRNRRK